MKGRLLALATVLALVFATRPARAEGVPVLVTGEIPAARVWLTPGWDPTLTLALGYSRTVAPTPAWFALQADAFLRLPLILASNLDAWQLAGGASVACLRSSGWGVVARIHPSLTVAHDVTGTKLGVGVGLAAQPGFYGRRFSVAVDLAWSPTLATRMWHSEAVRDLYRDRHGPGGPAEGGPRDGWYRTTAQRFRVGLAGGVRFLALWAVHASAGFAYTPQHAGILINPPVGPLPFYADLGAEYRW